MSFVLPILEEPAILGLAEDLEPECPRTFAAQDIAAPAEDGPEAPGSGRSAHEPLLKMIRPSRSVALTRPSFKASCAGGA